MKLATQFSVLPRFLNAFNYNDSHVKNAPNNCLKHNYWDQECLENPTNYSCLIYCD